MIQFNLLPNVKQEYVRTRRNKRLTLLIAGLAAATSLAIMLILFVSVQLLQKHYSSALSADIKTQSNLLSGTQDLNKILTIQNQLNSLPALNDKKPEVTRLLGYIKQVTPAKVSMAALSVDLVNQTMTISGAADSISTVNTFVDTLKFTTYTTADEQTGPAFSSVVLSGFGKDVKGASYQLAFKYDPAIFSSASSVSLNVPKNKITTRSETEKPSDLFQSLSKPQSGQ